MTARERLPDRRYSAIVDAHLGEHRFSVGVGYYADGRPGEVFYGDGQRSGTQLQHVIQDACVLISVALQYGVPIAEMRKSLGVVPGYDGDEPASVIGVICDAVEAAP